VISLSSLKSFSGGNKASLTVGSDRYQPRPDTDAVAAHDDNHTLDDRNKSDETKRDDDNKSSPAAATEDVDAHMSDL
jgi:hypothetical protein